jgi:ribosome-associated protein
MIVAALTAPKRRVPTKPTLGSKKRRLKEKKVRGEVKSLRGKIDPDT